MAIINWQCYDGYMQVAKLHISHTRTIHYLFSKPKIESTQLTHIYLLSNIIYINCVEYSVMILNMYNRTQCVCLYISDLLYDRCPWSVVAGVALYKWNFTPCCHLLSLYLYYGTSMVLSSTTNFLLPYLSYSVFSLCFLL